MKICQVNPQTCNLIDLIDQVKESYPAWHWCNHRYRKKNRLLKVCYAPATSATFLAFFSFFLAAAIKYTLLSSLYYLDVYGCNKQEPRISMNFGLTYYYLR